jgi:hypothetical protein
MAEPLNTNEEKTAEAISESMAEDGNKPVFPDFDPENETYPWESLPQMAKGAVIELCKNEGLAIAIAAQTVLSAISIACQDLIWVDRGIAASQKSVCSLFFLGVADTGSRKSRADQLIIGPIESYDLVKRAEFEDEMATYELEQDSLKRKIRELEKVAGHLLRKSLTLPIKGGANAEELAIKAGEKAKEIEQELFDLNQRLIRNRKPRWKKVLYEKIPIRQLEQSMGQNYPSAGLVSDEAAGILNSKGESDMASLDRLWDGGSIDVVGRTKHESFFLHDPRLTLSLMVQPIVFDRFLQLKGEMAKGIGLMSRTLLSRPDTPYGKRIFKHQKDRSTVWIDLFNKQIKKFLTHSHSNFENRDENRKTLYFEPDAQKFWEDIYNAVELDMAPNGTLEHEREFANRIGEHVARLSALFHFFECGDKNDLTGANVAIPKSTVQAAADIVDWHSKEFKAVFNQEARMREMAKYVLSKLKYLLEQLNGFPMEKPTNDHISRSIPVQELRAHCSKYGLKKIENFRPVLDWLHNRGNVLIRESSRPSNKMPDPPRRSPESVEIKGFTVGNHYEFFFELDHPRCIPRSK